MRRHLFVVSRLDPDLYQELRLRFADEPNVEVIVDRRHGERRRRTAEIMTERRRSDRRNRPEADAELLERSYTVVTIEE